MSFLVAFSLLVLPTVISRSKCQGTAIGKLALPVAHTYHYGAPSMTYSFRIRNVNSTGIIYPILVCAYDIGWVNAGNMLESNSPNW